MKKILLALLTLAMLTSCDRSEDYRREQPGIATSIKGNISDHYRGLPIEHFQFRLYKSWDCTSSSGTCTKLIKTIYSDANGDYVIDFDHNLRPDEQYRVEYDRDTPYMVDEYMSLYDPEIVVGQENILNINAWLPVKVKIDLTVLNNHTPPLVTGFKHDGDIEFGTNLTYEENAETFELRARPGQEGSIDFWYIVDYTTNHPVSHVKSFPYHTGLSDSEVLHFEVDCNDF